MRTPSGIWRTLWFFGIILVCLLLVAATLADIRDFNLRRESNYAALWSGMLLLLCAFHAFDGAASNRPAAPSIARAWFAISLVMVLLSFDEIASLHERLPADTHLVYWLWVAPFAFGFACAAAYSLIVLYRTDRYRWSAKLIGLGFLLFGSVAVQEEIEWRLDWSSDMKPIRGAIEEGTELLGMILVLAGSMRNTRGLLSRNGWATFPVLEAVRAWRRPVLLLGLVAVPIVALATVNMERTRYGHGLPGNWPPAAIFLLAAFAVIRPLLNGSGRVGWLGWGLTGICLVGCATITLDIDSGEAFLPMGVISGAAMLIWIIDSKYTPRLYLPAVVFLAACLGGVWFLRESDLAHYCLVSYVALGLYYVLSASSVTEARPRSDESVSMRTG